MTERTSYWLRVASSSSAASTLVYDDQRWHGRRQDIAAWVAGAAGLVLGTLIGAFIGLTEGIVLGIVLGGVGWVRGRSGGALTQGHRFANAVARRTLAMRSSSMPAVAGQARRGGRSSDQALAGTPHAAVSALH